MTALIGRAEEGLQAKRVAGLVGGFVGGLAVGLTLLSAGVPGIAAIPVAVAVN